MYTPANPSFFYIKVGLKGVKNIKACFRDVLSVVYYLRCTFTINNFVYAYVVASDIEMSVQVSQMSRKINAMRTGSLSHGTGQTAHMSSLSGVSIVHLQFLWSI